MRFVFLLIATLIMVSCSGSFKKDPYEKNANSTMVRVSKAVPKIPEIDPINYDSLMFHDSIMRIVSWQQGVDSQWIYYVIKPVINLKKIIAVAKCKEFKDFNDDVDYSEFYGDSSLMQLFFSPRIDGIGYWDAYEKQLLGYKLTEHADYLFYELIGPCVGSYFCCLSMDKKGNIISNQWLSWGWEYDDNSQSAILTKETDSTYLQRIQEGYDYGLNKGEFQQISMITTRISFKLNGIILADTISYDSIPKRSKDQMKGKYW